MMMKIIVSMPFLVPPFLVRNAKCVVRNEGSGAS